MKKETARKAIETIDDSIQLCICKYKICRNNNKGKPAKLTADNRIIRKINTKQ